MVGMIGLSNASQALDIQGHRGARGLMPENTLPAFAKALSTGVTTLELDLAVSKDLHVVVSHNPQFDPDIARLNGDWLMQSSPSIHSLTLKSVKNYDVGRLNPAGKYARRFPDQQSVDDTPVPTLNEVFELVNRSGNDLVRFNIEIKINPEKPELTLAPKEFAEAVIKVILNYRMQTRSVIQSFDWRVLAEVQTLAPDISTSYLTVNQSWANNLQTGMPGSSPWLNGFDVDDFDGIAARAIKAAGGTIWSAYHKEASPESIKIAHELGLSVNVWTVNEPGRMRELIEIGVDGIITDYPDRLRLVLEELGLPVPVATPVSPE
ncbi:MAG: glycerophosphodiester phosphodiesterase [Gammaproteobacteria bacterium]|nr:glycerophosphodiester phosphodiesterase [Gammaproteobacteria bacterium]